MRPAIARGVAAAVLAGVAIACAIALPAQERADQDAARAAWRYRRTVQPPAGADGEGRFVAIAIPPEVAEHSQPGLQDLRLIGADGREVPFVLDADVPRATERRRSGRLVEAQRERRNLSAWTVDFGVEADFDRLELEDRGHRLQQAGRAGDVARRHALDARRGRGLGLRPAVARPPGPRHDARAAAALRARFVRLTIDDFRSAPIVVRSVTAVLTGTIGGRRWTRDAPLVRLETPAGQPSRYRIDAAPGLPIERRHGRRRRRGVLARRARVRRGARRCTGRRLAGHADCYRVRLDDADLDAEQRDIDPRAAAGRLA